MNWIKANKKKLAGAVAALLGLFFAIAELTSTPKDDAIADKLKPVQEKLQDYASDTNSVSTNTP